MWEIVRAGGPLMWPIILCSITAAAIILERLWTRSEEHTSELQSRGHLVCRLLLEKKKKNNISSTKSLSYTIDYIATSNSNNSSGRHTYNIYIQHQQTRNSIHT